MDLCRHGELPTICEVCARMSELGTALDTDVTASSVGGDLGGGFYPRSSHEIETDTSKRSPSTLTGDRNPPPSQVGFYRTNGHASRSPLILGGSDVRALAAKQGQGYWPVPGLVPPGATLLFGPPKLGKTTLSMDVAWSVASGNDALGAAMTHQGDVLYVAAETTSADLATLHDEMFPDEPWPDRLSVLPLESFKDLGDQPLFPVIEGWAATSSLPTLLIIDTVQKVLWARQKINPTMRAQTQDYEAIRYLQEWVSARGMSVLLIHHTNQRTLEKGEDWLNKAAGTTGLVAATDTNMMLARDGDMLVLKAQGRNLAEREWYVSRHGRRLTLFDTIETGPRTGDRMKAVLEAVIQCGGSASPADVTRETGLEPATVRQYLRRAVQRGQLHQSARGVYHLEGFGEQK